MSPKEETHTLTVTFTLAIISPAKLGLRDLHPVQYQLWHIFGKASSKYNFIRILNYINTCYFFHILKVILEKLQNNLEVWLWIVLSS